MMLNLIKFAEINAGGLSQGLHFNLSRCPKIKNWRFSPAVYLFSISRVNAPSLLK